MLRSKSIWLRIRRPLGIRINRGGHSFSLSWPNAAIHIFDPITHGTILIQRRTSSRVQFLGFNPRQIRNASKASVTIASSIDIRNTALTMASSQSTQSARTGRTVRSGGLGRTLSRLDRYSRACNVAKHELLSRFAHRRELWCSDPLCRLPARIGSTFCLTSPKIISISRSRTRSLSRNSSAPAAPPRRISPAGCGRRCGRSRRSFVFAVVRIASCHHTSALFALHLWLPLWLRRCGEYQTPLLNCQIWRQHRSRRSLRHQHESVASSEGVANIAYHGSKIVTLQDCIARPFQQSPNIWHVLHIRRGGDHLGHHILIA